MCLWSSKGSWFMRSCRSRYVHELTHQSWQAAMAITVFRWIFPLIRKWTPHILPCTRTNTTFSAFPFWYFHSFFCSHWNSLSRKVKGWPLLRSDSRSTGYHCAIETEQTTVDAQQNGFGRWNCTQAKGSRKATSGMQPFAQNALRFLHFTFANQ